VLPELMRTAYPLCMPWGLVMLEAMKKSKFAVAVDSIGPKANSSSAGVVIAGRSEQFGPVPTTAASTKEKNE